jgi:hypothetical protein
MMTLSLVLLILNWLISGNLVTRIKSFLSCKPAVAFTLIYALNVIGLIWTKDFRFALQNDLLHKLPTLLLPIIITTSPTLSPQKTKQLLLLFVASVFTVSIVGLTIRIFGNELNFREASPFVPNIYFSMMLVISAVLFPYIVNPIKATRAQVYLIVTVSLWFVFYLFFMRSLSGIIALMGVLGYLVFKSTVLWVKMGFSTMLLLLTIGFAWVFIDMYNITHTEAATDLTHLPTHTQNGNRYYHDTQQILRENGNLVYIHIADKELARQWKQVSDFDYYGKDRSNHEVRFTLYRYMASKGLPKDSLGFSRLSQNDIGAIENGVPNYLYTKWPGIFVRFHQAALGLYMYKKSNYRDPSWSTLTERIDLWRASFVAFKEKPLLGWGTGSIHVAQEYGLSSNQSALQGKAMKPHSQYLYILLTLGVVGLIAYILLYGYFVTKTEVYKLFLFNVFIIVFAINFIANNSFESQVGQNMFVLFSLIYWQYYTAGVPPRR